MDLSRYIIPGLSEIEFSFLKDAFHMAEKAGDIQMKYFRRNNLEQSTKLNDSDVVTIADKQSEDFILDYIHNHYPEHGIISEESGNENEGRDWRWVIDPLDGTTNFSSGLPAFCVSIALELNGEAILGVVYAPYLKECFYAVQGKGAWLNGKQIHCSEKSELSKAVLATGVPYDRKENPDNNMQEIVKLAMYVRGIRRMGSAAIDLSYTGAGFFDAYWELNLNRWDVAAGQLIAKEAGAIIESIRSNRNHSILVSNPYLYPSIRELLRKE
ncbi:MAG: inositol monophosphatase [Muribaculaceae bacterium]|nr:inositol monophosphatase [Muribaculaceae bacterium]